MKRFSPAAEERIRNTNRNALFSGELARIRSEPFAERRRLAQQKAEEEARALVIQEAEAKSRILMKKAEEYITKLWLQHQEL